MESPPGSCPTPLPGGCKRFGKYEAQIHDSRNCAETPSPRHARPKRTPRARHRGEDDPGDERRPPPERPPAAASGTAAPPCGPPPGAVAAGAVACHGAGAHEDAAHGRSGRAAHRYRWWSSAHLSPGAGYGSGRDASRTPRPALTGTHPAAEHRPSVTLGNRLRTWMDGRARARILRVSRRCSRRWRPARQRSPGPTCPPTAGSRSAAAATSGGGAGEPEPAPSRSSPTGPRSAP